MQKSTAQPIETKVIDNFGGRLTRFDFGDMNSGNAKYTTTFGNDPFSTPPSLTWGNTLTQIDPNGSVITDLIVAGAERVESGKSYVYCVGHTGRVYKIQVNDPSTYNPSYDNPILLTTLTLNSPTFTRGGSMQFYGTTQRIYIGHDKGVTQIEFDGTSETFVGDVSTWVQNVPRPVQLFIGSMFFGNGNNIAQVDSTLTVVTYEKLSPSFPSGTQVRDLDTSTDGNYLYAVVTGLALPDITATTQDTSLISNSDSYTFKWNGTDMGYTSFDSFPSFSVGANIIFGQYQYSFGYDLTGACVFSDTKKILSVVLNQTPLPNAVGSNGNIVGWVAPESVGGFLQASFFLYGPFDNEITVGWWRPFRLAATGSETDILKVPFQLIVSNLLIGPASNGYPSGIAGTGHSYISTIETSAAPTVKYKLYRFDNVSVAGATTVPGVYETQTELFSKKIKVSEVRVYVDPLVSGNSFTIELIDASGNAIANSSKTFTVGSTTTAGQDYCWYTPLIEPTYALGVRITNVGSVNWICNKIEVDYSKGGK